MIPFHHRQRSVLEVNRELLLGLANFLFGTFAVGNVAGDPQQADDSVRVAKGTLRG